MPTSVKNLSGCKIISLEERRAQARLHEKNEDFFSKNIKNNEKLEEKLNQKRQQANQAVLESYRIQKKNP